MRTRRVGATRRVSILQGVYLRAPRWGFRTIVWWRLRSLRFGLLMMKVPLPIYFAL